MLKRICQICGNGYNNNRKKCLGCGNTRMVLVKTVGLFGAKPGDVIFQVIYYEQKEGIFSKIKNYLGRI